MSSTPPDRKERPERETLERLQQARIEELENVSGNPEPSKEELRSLNQELVRLNAELARKVEETARAHADMQNLFAATRIATLFLDAEMRIQKFTPAATELFNLIESDLGRPLFDLTARFEVGGLLEAIRRINVGDGSAEVEVRDESGRRWFVARVLPYYTVEFIRQGVVVSFVDVTSLKRTEEQLRQVLLENENLHQVGLAFSTELDLSKLMEKTTDAATRATKAQFGAFFYNTINDMGESYTLYSISGVPKEAFSCFPMPRNTEVFGPTFRGEKPVRSDDIRKDPRYGRNAPFYGMPKGHLPVVSYLAVPVVSRSGEVFGGLFFGHGNAGVFDDRAERLAVGIAAQAAIALENARLVEDLRRAARDLEQSEQRFRQLADSMPQIVWCAGPQGGNTYMNRRWYEFTGADPRQDFDPNWRRVLHPGDTQRLIERWTESLRTGAPFEIRYRFHDRASGRYRWFLGRALAVQDEAGEVARWFGTCTDIDELVRAEQALQEGKRRKDEFLAMLAHELRNPLAPIRHGLHLLEQPDTSEKVAAEVKATLNRQVRHLSRIVDDLLDVSRISGGRLALRREALDLVELVRDVSDDYRPRIGENRLAFEVEMPDRAVWIEGDRTRLTQAISNLLHNASKFTAPGGRVRLGVSIENQKAVVFVDDTGVGMPRELLERIFEPFSQSGASLDRHRGGLGLGLALVKGVLELHGGTVAAASPGPGKGSTFRMEIPLSSDPGARPEALDALINGAQEKPDGEW